MKKIILSALLLLSNIAFAQDNHTSSNTANTAPNTTANNTGVKPVTSIPVIEMPPIPPINTVMVKAPSVFKATWQDKTYVLTEKDIKENNKYETTFSFYRDKKLVSKMEAVNFANYPNPIVYIQQINYIASLSKNPGSEKLIKNQATINFGLAVTYVIIPSDGDDESVLVRDFISSVDLLSIQKIYEKDNVNYIEEPKTSVNLHNQTSLVPVGREVILVQWGNEDVRVLVKKVK